MRERERKNFFVEAKPLGSCLPSAPSIHPFGAAAPLAIFAGDGEYEGEDDVEVEPLNPAIDDDCPVPGRIRSLLFLFCLPCSCR